MKEKSIKLNAVLNVMKTVLSLVFPLITFCLQRRSGICEDPYFLIGGSSKYGK